jgi:AmmeMemoRadiSam system protein B
VAPPKPRLRPVDAFPLAVDGRELLALRDPSGIAERMVAVPVGLAPLLARCDGSRTLADLVAAHRADTGVLLALADVEAMVDALDRAHLLDSPAFAVRRLERLAEFRAGPRPSAHAGSAYPADRARLVARLEALERGWDAAAADWARAGRAARGASVLEVAGAPLETRAPDILVAPHIDLRVGGELYVPPYRALGRAGGADLAVVLGVGHAGIPGLFAAATTDFSTPLGTSPTDRAFVRELETAFGEPLADEELAHLTEHTVEFQVLFLQRAVGPACRVVPLLTSFGLGEVYGAPTGDRIRRLASALGDTIARRRALGERVVLVVSADLAHVGPRYGDAAPFGPEALAAVEAADRRLLAAVASGDPAAVAAEVAAVDDRYRVCGFSPIYLGLLAGAAREGRLLAYGRGPTDGAGSVCSYASLALYR